MDLKSVELDAVRAAEIAAAGGYGLAIIGPGPTDRLRIGYLYARLLAPTSMDRFELAKANGGILVLEEAPRFDRAVLEAITTALEDGALV